MAPPSARHTDESSTSKYPNPAVRCRGKPRRLPRGGGHHQAFLSGPRSVAEALSAVRNNFQTERYVFVGTDETGGAVKTVPDWTYQWVADAATAADWKLTTPSTADDDWP